MLGVPHWFGHWTGNRGQWYWWFCRGEEQVRLAVSRRDRNSRCTCPHLSSLSALRRVDSPEWYQRQTPCRSTCTAAYAWDTPPCHAGTVADASSSPRTCSRSKRSLEDTHPGDSGAKKKILHFKTNSLLCNEWKDRIRVISLSHSSFGYQGF